MARATTTPEIKAAALADLANGEQPAIVAQRYGLDRTVVKMWKARHVTTSVTDSVTDVTVMRRPEIEVQQLALGELVLENLRAKLIATQRIADHATTTDWLHKQTAADLAELFECLDRSAVNILDRLAGARKRAGDDEP